MEPQKSALYRLADSLRQVRESAGLSLTDFAKWSGYSSSHVSRVERGETTPSRELVDIYEARFHTDGVLRSLYAMVLDAQETDRLARRGVKPRSQGMKARPDDRSEFVADLTIRDGTIVRPGERLVKRWRLRNAGAVPWRGRSLERIGAASGPAVISSPHRVPIRETMPGETVDIAVELIAPPLPGSTIAYWQMVDEGGMPCFPDRYHHGIYVELVVRD